MTRKELLLDLLLFKRDLNLIKDELSKFSFDLEEPLIIIERNHVLNALYRCLNDEITFAEFVDWANMIEFRDDLDFENEELKEIVFELANPEINEITKGNLESYVSKLK